MSVVYWLLLLAGCAAVGAGVWVARQPARVRPWPVALVCSGLGLTEVGNVSGHFGWPWALTVSCLTLGLVLILTGAVTLAVRRRGRGTR